MRSELLNVRCDCHGSEILAQVENGHLVVRNRRHGVVHEVIVDLAELLAEARRKGGQTAPPKRTVPQAARQPSESRVDPWPTPKTENLSRA